MPVKCNHTSVQAVFVGMAHSYQGRSCPPWLVPPVGTGHAREVQPHQRADPVRGHGPLLPSQGEKLSALAGTTLWERAMPVKCNHSSVQALFVGMGPLLPSQGEKLTSLAGTILWERAMPEKCNHTNVQ